MSINLSEVKNLVFSGGGLLGLSYIGLFKYLEEYNDTASVKYKLNTITGCSAGAIFGTFLAIGCKSYELEAIFKTLYFPEYLQINADSIINFINSKGLESGRKLMSVIKNIIKDKTGDENITFSQIKAQFNINLYIGVTNLTKSQFELFGIHNMSDLPIYKAINASLAIPLIFEPVIIDNDIYCDGGLLDNLPIEYILKLITPADNVDRPDNLLDTLGIYLMNNFNVLTADNYQTASITHYLSAIMHTICNEFITTKINNDLKNEKIKNKYKIIVYNIPCDIMTFIKINATCDDIYNIINIAYATTKKQLETSI